jgi:hypothetical protein
VSDTDTMAGMSKVKTVPIQVRVTESDVAALDKAAQGWKPLPVTRSLLVAMIVREWVEKRQSPKKK